MFGTHGYERSEVTDVKVRPGSSRAVLEAADIEIESLCAPCPVNAAAAKLAELRSMTITRQRDGVDMDVAAGAYTSRLAQYPVDVVAAACDAWADREQFWPSWAELRDECEKRVHGRRQIRDAIRKALQ